MNLMLLITGIVALVTYAAIALGAIALVAYLLNQMMPWLTQAVGCLADAVNLLTLPC